MRKKEENLMRKLMRKELFVVMSIGVLLAFLLIGCGGTNKKSTVTVFAAKSLNTVMDELIEMYKAENPDVTIITNYDSSGTLQTQIEEGAVCDIFFSAAQKQMNALEEKGLLVDGTRANLVNNQVCLVKPAGTSSQVGTLGDIGQAESIALAAGSVPVGKYTRVALINLGLIPENDDPSAVTTEEISEALGGITINECANVGAVAAAIAEGANEVGTVYYSDYKGFEDKMDIIEVVPYELTGDVIYPIAQIVNKEASAQDLQESVKFLDFLKSDKAKAVYEKYYFDTNVK